ncbi:MAG TPA: hypothetical protein VFU38_05165, partial [Candidatus Krumholzibacteria bacterium]|nr:hypothetical protein [Candidatus Krumholzibacteria bacterium]
MYDVTRRFGPPVFRIFALAAAIVLAVTVAQTDDKSPVTGEPAGLTSQAPVVAPDNPVDPVAEPQESTQPEQAHWENGELMAPLPSDEMLRRAALDQALASAMARPNNGTQHATGGSGGMAAPDGARSTADRIPDVKPFIPADVRAGDVTWNLKLPDQFDIDPAVFRGVGADGKPLTQALRDKGLNATFAPALTQWWESIGQTNLRPPDCDVSAGPSHVISVVNARFAIYDKCGNNLYENDIAAFVGNGVDFFFDPKVHYDVWDGRWFITCCVRNNGTQQSWVLLLFSDDSDPIGAWNWYYLDFDIDGGTPTAFWADYQDIGTSPDGIHITSNQFNWAAPPVFQYAKIRNLDKADVLNLGGICWWDFWSLTNPANGSLAFTLRVADMNTWPGEQLFVNSVSFGGNFLTVWRLLGPACAPVSLTSFNLPVNVYDDPPPMQQPNATFVDCGDARLLNASYANSRIWTGQGIRHNFGEPVDRSVVRVYQFDPFALAVLFQTSVGIPGYYMAYPAVDFDNNFSGIMTCSFGGPTEFPGSVYLDLGNGGPWGGALNYLIAGANNYNDLVNAGTPGDPFRWGDYYGADRDPQDNKTIWMYGQNAPTPTSWGTRVGATAPVGAGALSVSPSPGLVSGGFVGGPFDPPSITYTLTNTGLASLSWTLVGLDAWNSASSFGGTLSAGANVNVTVTINATANGFAPGVYTDNYSFTNCYGNIANARSTVLHVGTDLSCKGSNLVLTPTTPPTNFGADAATFERGVYVTAIKNFNLCAVGYKMDLPTLPQTLEARVYAANGTTRGALLTSNSINPVQLAHVVHSIPINFTLRACQDYEIVVVVPAGAAWEWWNENLITEPFDVGGAVRVRDGSSNGNPINFALPHIELFGQNVGPENVTALSGPGAPPNPAPDDNQERGVFIKMLDTAQLCGFGWEADLVPGQTLTARVYEAVGVVRGALIATGTYVVPAAGSMWHDVPINVQLVEGKDYDVAISFGLTNNWQWWSELVIPTPFDKGIFRMVTSEAGGGGGNFALPHYRMHWEDKTGGAPFDLAKLAGPHPAPNVTGQDNSDYGAYITSVIDQHIYSLGWEADIPPGQIVTARVFEAVGLVRGALISEGTAYSGTAGMRWHDVPVSADFVAGGEYDISIEWQTVTTWRWWHDTSDVPYTSYGIITVRNSEAFGGGSGNTALIRMRVFGCDADLTPVEDKKPVRTPMFLATPAPNPVSSQSRLDFALEEDGPVSIVVYAVAGRRVTTLLDGQRPKGWHSVDLDSGNRAS